MKKKEPALLLCRISDLKQNDGYSLDAQKKYGVEYCKKNSLEIIQTYSFVETASKSNKRSKFDEMVKYIARYATKATTPLNLIVEKKDRLTRNFTSQEKLQLFVVAGKLKIHYYKDKKIFDDSCSPADIFNDDIQTAVAKYTALNTGREVKKGMREKAAQGICPCKAPLGYKNARIGQEGRSGRKEAVIIVDPDTRNVKAVQRIFELRATTKPTMSLHNITKQIVEEGILPPQKAKSICKAGVANILSNPFYTGRFEWQGEWFKGKHEVIIPWKHLNEVHKTKKGKHSIRPKGIFSGLLTCANTDCDCAVTYDPKTKKLKNGDTKLYHYYHCTDGKRVHKDSGVKQINVSETHLFEEYKKPVKDISIRTELADAISDLLKKTHNKAIAAQRRNMTGYRQAIRATEQKEDEVYDDHKSGTLDEEAYRRHIKKIRIERMHYEGLLEQVQVTITGAFYETSERILELAKDAELLWNSRTSEERVEFLKDILSNQTLDGINIRYNLKKPFKIISEMKNLEENREWCPGRDLNSYSH